MGPVRIREIVQSWLPLVVAVATLFSGRLALSESSPSDIFAKEIYPLLHDNTTGTSCVDCHDGTDGNDLVFSGNAREDFLRLRDGGYLNLSGPDTLLGRVTTANVKKRMPKGKNRKAWSVDTVNQLRKFLEGNQSQPAAPNDGKSFPPALLEPYRGEPSRQRDNQFISFHQLQGKMKVLFAHDDSKSRVLADNVSLFGGADFETRFNESRDPSSAFLSTLDKVTRTIAGRAFTQRSGVFKHRDPNATLASDGNSRDVDEREIVRLYRALLYRAPTALEMRSAKAMLNGIAGGGDSIVRNDHFLVFRVTATDPVTGMSASEETRVPVLGRDRGLIRTYVDQTAGDKADKKTEVRSWTVGNNIRFQSNVSGQGFRISNAGCRGRVSFVSVQLCDPKSGDVVWQKDAEAPELQTDGAWNLNTKGNLVSYDDRFLEKVDSSLFVPLDKPLDGDFDVVLRWRDRKRGARNVPFEIFCAVGDDLALSPAEEQDPKNEARFRYDCGDDTKPYARFPGRYRLGKEGFLEINNAGTTELVAAAAAHFVNADQTVSVDSREAEGEAEWGDFKSRSFRAYNVKGKAVDDKNADKGERFLRYRPGKVDEERKYDPTAFYNVRLFYPGKNGHEPYVPVRIVAEASSPLLRVRSPLRARAGGRVTLDASGSFTVQGSSLTYRWEQLDGPTVEFDPHQPKIEFTAPARDANRQAWVSLCRALVRHPDFLFTRPPSLWSTDDSTTRRRLQLVKLALDLVGRPPTPEESHRLDEGAAWEDLVDSYLDSREFRDFYFHRIRLYLESQGTVMQDEPARIWSYVAFQDRPFQEILTANYTVGPEFAKKKRSRNHGRTGVLTARGFIEGKPGLPHYNYAAQVSMLFLGYIYEVPPEIVEQREGSTALGTTDPNSVCFSCHKILTPLAHQRLWWTDDGKFRRQDDKGKAIDASDRGLVGEYPFRGQGMEAFAMQAVKTERFVRTMIDTHFQFYFGRRMRYREEERVFYKELWDEMQANQFQIRHLIRHMVNSQKYRSG